MKKLFENWRKHITEAEYEPGRAVADIDTGEERMSPEARKNMVTGVLSLYADATGLGLIIFWLMSRGNYPRQARRTSKFKIERR